MPAFHSCAQATMSLTNVPPGPGLGLKPHHPMQLVPQGRDKLACGRGSAPGLCCLEGLCTEAWSCARADVAPMSWKRQPSTTQARRPRHADPKEDWAVAEVPLFHPSGASPRVDSRQCSCLLPEPFHPCPSHPREKPLGSPAGEL